jgi:hypothetical protein
MVYDEGFLSSEVERTKEEVKGREDGGGTEAQIEALENAL